MTYVSIFKPRKNTPTIQRSHIETKHERREAAFYSPCGCPFFGTEWRIDAGPSRWISGSTGNQYKSISGACCLALLQASELIVAVRISPCAILMKRPYGSVAGWSR